MYEHRILPANELKFRLLWRTQAEFMAFRDCTATSSITLCDRFHSEVTETSLLPANGATAGSLLQILNVASGMRRSAFQNP